MPSVLAELEQSPHPSIRKSTRIYSKKFDSSEALRLRLRGNSYGDIARLLGVTKGAIIQRLKPLLPDTNRLPGYEAYKANQADFLDAKAYQALVHTVTEQKLKQLDAYRGALTTAILTDKARLIRGESTQNLSVRGVVEHYQRDLEAATVALHQLTAMEVIEKTQE